MKIKMRRAAQERQEELALDMKILEQLLEESRNEAMEQKQRKMQLREENQKYRKYLQEQVHVFLENYIYTYINIKPPVTNLIDIIKYTYQHTYDRCKVLYKIRRLVLLVVLVSFILLK